MYTIIEKTPNGQRIQGIESYNDAKKQALALKQATGNECNVLTNGIAVWTTEGETNTDAVYFM